MNQEESEQNEVVGMKKGAGEMMRSDKVCFVLQVQLSIRSCRLGEACSSLY